MSRSSKYKTVNALLFQAGWFTCILLPSFAALICTVIILLIHFKMSENEDREMLLVFAVGTAGYFMDSIYSLTGKIDLAPGNESMIYLVCVWLLFAASLNSSLKWFCGTSMKSILLGILAPVSYFAAQQFGKVKYSEPLVSSMLIHALLWGLFMLIVHKVFFGQNIQRTNERQSTI